MDLPLMTVRILRSAATGAVALGALSCSDSTGPGDKLDTFEWDGTIAAGDVVEVKGINGNIRALPSTGDAVRIVATKRGSDDDPSTVTIEVVEHDGGVTVCAVYPDVPGEPANECLPGEGGFLSNRGNDVSVAFDVEVPTSAVFVGVTVAGSITATGLGEDVYATTVDGHIELSTDGQARGTTVNGNVTATIGQADWNRDLSFVTVNGNVTVRVPAETNAEVTAATVNGSVSSDFGLTISGDGRLMTGTLGVGGRMLTLTTVNGNVALRER
jgi:DUF4097 and DUF4098 domain-containing protein YvlB